ncbi:MAG: D-tyrosyl-tRNA(Tyr) deacylase [Lachnospiraceae bacterium]|nr:D-tyrosyl-tRNA(Tyr) deacylase [Lachnospiraceae bacterium]
MRFVIQRVTHAKVTIDGEVHGSIDGGYMVLIGIEESDNSLIASKMVDKMLKLRIFEDENGKTNLSLTDVGGSLLLISQFTLYADAAKCNRPSFIRAGKPDMAAPLYEEIIKMCRDRGFKTETGIFGADMKVELLNDGPFTVILDSKELFKNI